MTTRRVRQETLLRQLSSAATRPFEETVPLQGSGAAALSLLVCFPARIFFSLLICFGTSRCSREGQISWKRFGAYQCHRNFSRDRHKIRTVTISRKYGHSLTRPTWKTNLQYMPFGKPAVPLCCRKGDSRAARFVYGPLHDIWHGNYARTSQ